MNKYHGMTLKAAAQRMTEIIMRKLDTFPPKERARRVKAYLNTHPKSKK